MPWFGKRAPRPSEDCSVVEWLDAVVRAACARRGMVIVPGRGGLRVLAARSDRRRDLSPPVAFSPSLCDQVLARGAGVFRIDVEGWTSRRSFIVGGPHMEPVATQCHPLACGGRVLGVLQLESRDDVRLAASAQDALRAAVAGLAAAVERAVGTA